MLGKEICAAMQWVAASLPSLRAGLTSCPMFGKSLGVQIIEKIFGFGNALRLCFTKPLPGMGIALLDPVAFVAATPHFELRLSMSIRCGI